MRTQRTVGTWKKPVEMHEIAQRIEQVLYNDYIYETARQMSEVEHGETPQYVSPTGNAKETEIGRIIHERTYGPNPTWDQRGEEVKKYAEDLKEEDKANAEKLKSKWKNVEEERNEIFNRLEEI